MIPSSLQPHLHVLGKLPGVRALFLSGSFALGTGKSNSDFDLFIITTTGRIWTARFWVFLYLKLTGTISTEKHHADRFCPNHFITVGHLVVSQQNRYMAELIAHMKPLYDPEKVLPAFQQANEPWIEKLGIHLPKTFIKDIKESKQTTLGNWFESLIENLQRWKIARNPLTHLPGAEIVLGEHELRFHPRPKWKKYEDEAKNR